MIMPNFISEDPDPWMLAEEIPDIDFQFSQIWLSSFVNDLEKTVGINYKKVLSIYHGTNLKFYYGEKDSDEFAKHVLNKIINSPSFGRKINSKIRQLSRQLKNFSKKLTPEYLNKLSNKELAKLYLSLDLMHTELYTWGWLPNAVDMFHGNFSNYLKDEIGRSSLAKNVNEVLAKLSVASEKSVLQRERESFLKLVVLKQSQNKSKFEKALCDHQSKYFHLRHQWLGNEGMYTKEYYESEIGKYIDSGKDARDELEKLEYEYRAEIKEKTKLLQEIKLGKRFSEILDIYNDFAVTKVIRRDAQIFWAYKMDFLFAELSKRFSTPIESLRFALPSEVCGGLLDGQLDQGVKENIRERAKRCAYFSRKGEDFIYTGTEVKEIEDQLVGDEKSDSQEISGQTACLGCAKGIVRIINSPSDMAKMSEGDILVSIATNPDIVPAMKKAAAIVTEQGGITSHAAIVSRELRTPCVIGTKIATKVLKDGDLVEVDANKGIVKILSM